MKFILSLLLLIPVHLASQSTITYYKNGIKYISCSIHFQSAGVSKPTDVDTLLFKGIPKLKGYTILLDEINTHSSQISIYKDTVIFQVFNLPFHNWYEAPAASVVDIDNNKYPDIILTYMDYDSSIAERRTHKVYLFNLGDKFKLVSFFDYETELEIDRNRDGILDIISCDKVEKNGKYFWVYNVFNFQDGAIKNVSNLFGYPLWSKQRIDRWHKAVPVNMTKAEKQTGYRELPNGYFSQ